MALVVPLTTFPITILTLATLTYVAIRSLYCIFLHPLRRIPGPILARCTPFYLYYHTYTGTEASAIHALHLKHGPVVRVAPGEVDVASGAALDGIYVERGGFRKSPCYENFHIDGHATIFSALDPGHRAPRAKAVASLFSTASIRTGGWNVLTGCVARMIARLEREAGGESGAKVNVLNLTRSLATDAVTAYLFHESYGGLDEEDGGRLSAAPFVDAFVAVGRFFYLPKRLFWLLEWAIEKCLPDSQTDASMKKVDEYVARLVDRSEKSDNYPGRLLRAGFSVSETRAQCKDLIFAGTDSTGMNLATICWYLARQPEIYERLRNEIQNNKSVQVDIQGLPYLKGVVREGLRLSMANPTRLPRVVPVGGWAFGDYELPAGTNVGISAYELHLDPKIFPEPDKFLPGRWLDSSAEMQRDWIPFGMGPRACIARNLATVELFMAVEKLAESGVLTGARTVDDKIEIVEWFNSKVKHEKIELVWQRN